MRFGWGGMSPTVEPTPEAEQRVLEGQVQALRSQLDAIEKRLEELKAEKVV
jgi:prefoldin subunit 5